MSEEVELEEIGSAASFVSPRILATAYVESVYQFFRQTELHEPDNAIFEYCVQNIIRTMSSLQEVGESEDCSISLRGEQLFVGKIRIRPKARQFHIYRYLFKFFRLKRIGALKLPKEMKPEEVRSFLWIVASLDRNDPNPIATVRAAAEEKGLASYQVEPALTQSQVKDGEHGGDLMDLELISVSIYNKLQEFVSVCFSNLDRAAQFDLPDYNEVMADLVELPSDDILNVFRANLMKERDRPLPYFAVDVCCAAVSWGQNLGLPAGVLRELGGAALGTGLLCLIRKEISTKTVEPKEAHALLVLVERLSSVWKFSELQSLSAIEWSIPYVDDGVYSWAETSCYQHFFSRMIRILACFRALTLNRKGFDPMLPDEAMTHMIEEENSYDTTLLKLFVNWLGVYPVGTLVELQTGEVAQVFAAGTDPLRFQRPMVSVLKDANGKLLERPYLLDLTEMNEKVGIYKRTIKRSLTSEEAGIPQELFDLKPADL